MKTTITVLTAIILFASCGNKVEKRFITSMDTSFVLKGQMSHGELGKWSSAYLMNLNTAVRDPDSTKRMIAIDSLLKIHDQVVLNFMDSTRNPIYKK